MGSNATKSLHSASNQVAMKFGRRPSCFCSAFRRNADHETCRLQDMKAANYYWFQESAKGISEARKRSWEGADIPYPVLAELAGAVIWRCHPFTLDTDKNYLFRLLRTVAK